MVTAEFRHKGSRLFAKCTGHATGDPAVCAACSAVMSVLSAVARESMEEGGSYYALLGTDIGSETVFRAVLRTMDRIAATYPKLVRVFDEI